jgi:hypothetical protein
MKAGIFARVPAVAVLVTVALLATATLTLAATSTGSAPPAVPSPEPEVATLVVPDVRSQAYVFAKGALEESGFAWKVGGSVQGYAVNVVASQTPAPGTRVIADGAPIVTLGLARNPSYKQEGLPENASPFAGRPVQLVGAKPKPAVAAPAKAAAAAPKAAAAKPKPLNAPKPAATPKPTTRKLAFAVPGAPKEPLDEIPLAQRATQLSTWLETHRTRTPDAVDHWLYQHNWIVTGASFGWAGGADALRTLIAVDRRVQELWGVGARSEAVARTALRNVERQAGTRGAACGRSSGRSAATR